MNLPRIYPNLDFLKLPDVLKTSIRRIYQLAYDLRDDTLAKFSALPPVLYTVNAILTVADPTQYIPVPQGGEIIAWTILANAGTPTVTTWKVPSGTAIPTAADSISISGVSLATGTALRSQNLADFSITTVANHDIVAIHLQAAGGAAKVVFQLEIIP